MMTSDPSELRQLIDAEAEHAEAHRRDPVPSDARGTRPNRFRSVTLTLRLNPDELAAVQALALERDVPASALVRGWIMQLGAERRAPTDTAAVVDRLEADVRTLRKLAAS